MTAAPNNATRPGRVAVHGVHKSFGAVEVLHGIDLTVEPGTVTVVLGPSGSGKSTLLRSINHLEKVDRGFVALDGELVGYRRKGDTLHELKEKELLRQRTRFGFVFQSFNLFPHLTALDNVVEAPASAHGRRRREAEAEARELLARAGLAGRGGARGAGAAGPGGAGRPRRRLPPAAVRGTAAAGRDRPGAGHAPRRPAVR